MSNSDSFIEEVAEEVRRDRLFRLMRRYGWIAVLAVLLLVGGAAWTEWRRAASEAAAEAAGDGLDAALAAEGATARAEALAALSLPQGTEAPRAMLLAAAQAEAGEAAAAAETLAALAADTAQPRVWRDLATLKRVLLLGPGLAPADRLAALEPLAAPGAPFRVLAVEQQALARLEAGEREAAQLMVALGGRPEAS